ncbi:iron ABC transporter permease [Proteiniclasticum sp.]|uniref:ABC transporter permease n=1 Tax=Proteiniclasticum sp. TaxID=2053595 RepID=UPI00289E886F|nr:iron ABC transporter permease [Proteiniclasticum sp.]
MEKKRKKQKFDFRNSLNFWNYISVGSFILLFIFLIYPFSSLFMESLRNKEGAFSLETYFNFFKLPYYFNTLKNSFIVCTLATIFSVLVGLPMAYITSRFHIAGKKFINLMVILSLLSPPFIGAYAWIILLGRNGLITNILGAIGITAPTIYGLGGIIFIFTLKFFPYVYLYASGALSSIDASLEEAGENLGMSSFKRIMTITFPLILPTITSAALLVFMTSLADFGTPMLIGEGFKTLPVVVYDEFMSELGGNAAMASTLSVIIVVFSLSVLFIQKKVVEKRSYMMSSLRPPEVKELPKGKKFLATAFCYIIVFLAMVQQIVVITTSFMKTRGPIFLKEFSLDNYSLVMNRLSLNIRNTFVYAVIALAVMIILGILVAYIIVRRRSKFNSLLDTLIMFPYVIPGSVLGITLLVAFNKQPLVLSGTAAIIIIAYIIRKLPYTVRSSASILYQIDPSIEEASINLGVSPMKTFFKVTAVMMAPGVFSGAILSWITTINELSSTVILYTGRTSTISVAVYTEVVRASFGTAAALASILTLTTIISIMVFNKVSGGRSISL